MSTAYASSPTSPITAGMRRLALYPKNTDDLNANSRPASDSSTVEARPIERSWESWGDGDVWRAARAMLATFDNKQNEKSNQPTKPEWGGPIAKGLDPTKPFQLRAPKSKQRRSSNEQRHVDHQWSNKRYFVVFPCVYCIDQEWIIYRIDEGFEQYRVTAQPLQPQATFNLQGMVYWLDSQGELWYQLANDWVKEVFYTGLQQALCEVIRCIENNNLQGTTKNLWIHTTSSDDSLGASSDPSSPTLSIGSDEGHVLPQLSQCPDRNEIDNWFQQLKRCRAIQAKAGNRLQEVRCPLGKCGKVQRRPQALRDHLYFHFGIKPYKCQFGCQQAFETKANMERHTDTCPIRWGTQ
ncbi:unnamed protein product [Rhizoctonia solani]|uniref:C2H2-type domain-containing protein n=1 Tax=Rhizoctonia solani TaxID=456999 RepID=A0A8H3BWJ2_9AGAM|nr:unnamed protein product [Rhizoctonia solani]CAE6467333.1 unnamed protein product [Rhizoctonia solani]